MFDLFSISLQDSIIVCHNGPTKGSYVHIIVAALLFLPQCLSMSSSACRILCLSDRSPQKLNLQDWYPFDHDCELSNFTGVYCVSLASSKTSTLFTQYVAGHTDSTVWGWKACENRQQKSPSSGNLVLQHSINRRPMRRLNNKPKLSLLLKIA